jgi:hypothetical protein
MPRSSVWSLFFRFSNQNIVRISHHLMHATCPDHSNIWSRVQLMKFLN